MAFDFGEKRVGVAVTDPLKIIANSLETIDTAKIYDFIKGYLLENEVERFIVGFPYNFGHNQQNPIIEKIHVFINKLNQLFPNIPIEKIDERFTSKMAAQAMLMGGMNKKDRQNKRNLDKISATIILQSYMEMNHL